jgi:hypothetical protein
MFYLRTLSVEFIRRPIAPVIGECVVLERKWNYTEREKLNNSEETLSQ